MMADENIEDWLRTKPAIVSMQAQTDVPNSTLFLSDHRIVEVGRFDCKKLDRDFLLHTGREFRDEIQANADGIDYELELPYPCCVFEFANEIVSLESKLTCWGGEMSDAVAKGDAEYLMKAYSCSLIGKIGQSQSVASVLSAETICADDDVFFEIRSFAAWEIEERYLAGEPTDYQALTFNDESAGELKTGAELALGVLCLLSERLIVKTSQVGGSSLTKNARAKNKGKAERHSYKILTLNLAEAKRRARQKPVGPHESPRLHWRRGHWRTLMRLSEFERQTWVKRCLVGDPDKGFVQKHYRAIWQPTIH